MTVEPNFTLAGTGRISVKDIFRPGMPIDRVFTFTAKKTWGVATLMPAGPVEPQPVHLADGRTFPVKLENGQPVIDWTGLIQVREADEREAGPIRDARRRLRLDRDQE